MTRRVLISGASIAGPTLAYWLNRHGFEPVVVERADALRGGGYPIDIRGTALDVVERMGALDDLTAAHVDTRRAHVIDGTGRTVASVRPEAFTGSVIGRDLEVPRGDLAAVLYERTRHDVEYVFGDSIASLDDRAEGVDVSFESGVQRTFDLVIGADGMHSNVRRLAFGPEEAYHRYLGWCFAGFSLPNWRDFDHEGFLYNSPGRMGAMFAIGDRPERLLGFLAHSCPQPPYETLRDNEAMRRLTVDAFADGGWEIPRMVAALRDADDAFCDSVSQIVMPTWSTGRVAVVGDAAYAPSFLSGQGTSIALVGGYVLAGELATHGDHRAAFASYEHSLRTYVERNQELAHHNTGVCMTSPREIWVRNHAIKWMLPVVARLRLGNLVGRRGRKAAMAFTLPAY